MFAPATTTRFEPPIVSLALNAIGTGMSRGSTVKVMALVSTSMSLAT